MTAMTDSPVGSTGLRVSKLGFGTAPLGGFVQPVASETAVDAIRAAAEAGIAYFDTAPLYGYGRSELLLGHVLRDLPREKFVLSTKVGRVLEPGANREMPPGWRPGGLPFVPRLDYTADGLRSSLEQSLLRIGLEHVDIVYLHDIDRHALGSDERAAEALSVVVETGYQALREMKEAGLIRAIGLGVNQPEWALRVAKSVDLDCIMIAGRYTLLNREAAGELIPFCENRGIALIAAGPYNGGVLADPGASLFNYRPITPERAPALARIRDLAADHGVSLRAAALQFALRNPAIASVVVGAVSREQILENVACLESAIPAGFWHDLESFHLEPAGPSL
jgi:D-threo-aldose 1-dehydrogenase